MASLTRWMWVWVNSGSWWWTGRPGMLRFKGSQRVGHDWAIDLIWSDLVVLGNRETQGEREWWGDSWFWKQSGQTHLSVVCCSLVAKNPLVKAGNIWDMGSIPGLKRSPGEGNGNTFQYSCLENPMDRGAWRAAVHGVAKSWTWLRWLSTSTHGCSWWYPRNNYSNNIKDPHYHNKYNNNEKIWNIVRIVYREVSKWVLGKWCLWTCFDTGLPQTCNLLKKKKEKNTSLSMKHNNAECNKMSYAYIQHLVFHLMYFFCEYNASVSLIKPQALCWSRKLIWGSMDPGHASAWTSPESFCPRFSGILREWVC